MKSIRPLTRVLLLAASLLTFSLNVHAHPYASGVATNGDGTVRFVLNEGGGNVTVTYEDNTTYPMGVCPQGTTNFPLGSHTGFKITVSKTGNGTPSLISSDTASNNIWANPRGVAVNKNPKNGKLFGRIYAGSGGTGGFAFGTPGFKPQGVFAYNADNSEISGMAVGTGTNAAFTPFYAAGGLLNGPWRMRVAPDDSLLVCDFSTANASLMQCAPDLNAISPVLYYTGQVAAVSASVHGDFFGTPVMTGSLAQSNLVLYTFDSGMGAPGDTNCILGPLTSPGSFNCVFRYNIGAGPLPWKKRPDYAYTFGLDGIAELRTEGDVGSDGKVYCAFGRANASNPNLQILAPVPTTNGITGDLANKDIQDAAKSPSSWLYTGGVTPPFNNPPAGAANDPWVGNRGSGVNNGTYAGVRVSPDSRFIASVDLNNGITLASLTNGIPNDGTLFGISQGTLGSTTGLNLANSRGMDWDPANNIWVISSGSGLLRCFSLGLTTTCITSNDWTGTNGTFQLVLPPLNATISVVNPTASQNYVNNTVNAGTPIPGVLRIRLNTSDTTPFGPTFVGFVRTGTALYTNNYTINTNETPNGVTIRTDGVIFPAGAFSGSNGPNWNVDVKIIPTALPVSGGTSNVNVRLVSGTNYSASAPLAATIVIINTGPQLLQLAAAAPATLGGMNRGIPNDQARFVITRLGDLNGPGNDAVNPVVARTLIITNINYLAPGSGASFKANLGVDYTAGAQNFNGSLPLNGSPGIVINPNVVSIPAMIGNPVKHINTSLPRTNLQVIINLTNTTAIGSPPSTTNVLSFEGYPYSVATTSLTLNEFDNALGGEVVLWSNPLTNSLESTNWTLVYASINQGGSPTLPTVITNYDNSANVNGSEYYAWFGKPVNDLGNDYGVAVPQSTVMEANGWTTALKMSVNKSPGSAGESGINLYPRVPGSSNFMVFQGNYALRFDMYLSLYDFGLNNPTIGTPAREFAAFGINHYGTNANWRLDINPRADGTGSRPINADGEWCSIGAASGSITPADYDMFISPPWVIPIYNQNGINTNRQPIPFTTNFFIGTNTAVVSSGQLIQVPYTNAFQFSPGVYSGITNVFNNGGVPNDQVSSGNNSFGGTAANGIIKNPPFSGINANGGAPDNAWVDVSLELTRQTNLTLKIAQQAIFNASILTPAAGAQNPIAPYGGTPMLGYLDPNRNISDYSAFVYYSNIRVVELSPFIPWTNQPVAGLIVTQGTTFSLSSGATFASNPLTNTWYRGTTNGTFYAGRPEIGTPTAGIATNVFNSTNGLATLTVTNIQGGTNYISTWSDQAGSVTNIITVIEVLAGPGNKTVDAGVTTNFTVTASGNAPPTYQWKFFGTNLVNSTHYGGVTNASLFITNVTAADAGVYSNLVVNAYGSLVVAGTLSVNGNVTAGFQPYQFSSIADLSSSVALSFTTTDSTDIASSFTLQSAGIVSGPYTNNTTGVFSGSNPNFLVTVPKTNTMLYFRLKHN